MLNTIVANSVFIGNNSFQGTKTSAINSQSISYIGSQAFYQCKGLSGIIISTNGTLSLMDGAFQDCSSLENVRIEKEIDVVGKGLFKNCTKLAGVETPGIHKITEEMFLNCPNLISVKISNNISEVGYKAFSGCTKLSSITFDVPEVQPTVLTTGNVPSGKISFGNLNKIGDYAFESTGITAFEAGKITGSIGIGAFKNSRSLESFRVGSVGSIGNEAFSGCSALVHFLDSVEESGTLYSEGVPGLYILKSTSVGTATFSNTLFENMVALSLESLSDGAFKDMTKLKTVVMECSNEITTLPLDTFSGCTSLSEVHLPDSISSLGDNAFYGAPSTLKIYSNATVLNNSTGLNVINQATNIRGVMSFSAGGRVNIINGSKTVIPYDSSGKTVSYYLTFEKGNDQYVQLYAGKSGQVITAFFDSIASSNSTPTLSFDKEVSGSERSFIVTAIPQSGSKPWTGTDTWTIDGYGDSIKLPTATSTEMVYTNYEGLISHKHFDQGSEFVICFYETQFVLQTNATTVSITWNYQGHGGHENVTVPYAKGSEVVAPVDYPALDAMVFKGWYTSDVGGIPMPSKFTAVSDATYYLRYDYAPTTIDIVFDGEVIKKFSMYGKVKITVSDSVIQCIDSKTTTDSFNAYEYGISENRGLKFLGYMIGVSEEFTGMDDAFGYITIDALYDEITYSIKLEFKGVDSSTAPTGSVRIGNGSFENGAEWRKVTFKSIVDGEVEFPEVKGTSNHAFSYSIFKVVKDAVQWKHEGPFVVSIDEIGTSSEAILYLYFEEGKYKLNFDTGKGLVISKTVKDTDAITKENGIIPSRINSDLLIGYDLEGWLFNGSNIETLLSGNENKLTQKMKDSAVDREITFTAKLNPIKYTLKFNYSGEGWTCRDESVVTGKTVKIGENFNLPGSEYFTKPMYSFKGWLLKDKVTHALGEVTREDLKQANQTTRVLDLYIDSTNRLYTVTLEYNNGYFKEGGWKTKEVEFGGSFTLPSSSEFVKEYCMLNSWTLVKDGSTHDPGVTVTIDSDLAKIAERNGDDTLKFSAFWNDNLYTVVYTYTEEGVQPNMIPTDEKEYKLNDPFSVQPHTFTSGSSVKSCLELNGYTLIGWSQREGSSVPLTDKNNKFSEDLARYAEGSKVYLYPVWKPLSYSIEYVLDGGSLGLYAPTSAYYGTELEISNPTKSGSRFTGWTATNINPDTAQYKMGSVFSPWDGIATARTTSFLNLTDVEGGRVVFTAHWESALYGLAFDLNGGAGSVEGGDVSGTINSNIKLASASKATKPGYVFAGWSVNGVTPIGGSGETVQLTELMASTADENNIITFKAVWSTIQYTIEFRESETDPYMKVTAFYDVSVPLGIPERPGYMFNGWVASALGSKNAMYSLNGDVWYSWTNAKDPANGAYVMNLTDKTGDTVKLTASWTPKNYKVVYNANGGTGKVPVDDTIYKVGDKLTLKPYDSLAGTYGSKVIRGWSLERNATAPMTLEEFSVGLAEMANSMNTVTFYAVWVDGMCTVNVDLDGSKVDDVPSGWSEVSEGIYGITVSFGTDVKTLLKDWPDPYKDGHIFKKWQYDLSTVTENMVIKPEFEEVSQDVVYYFAAGAVGVIALLVVVSRFEWI